jgi:hypothetical protein
MARRTTEKGGAFRVVVTVEWSDGQRTVDFYGPYAELPTARAVLARKVNPRYFADYTRWNPPTPQPVRATGHIDQPLMIGWARVEPTTAANL